MTRQFAASRMTVLLGAALAWLAIGFDARSLAAEEPQPGNATLAPADRVEQVLKAADLRGPNGELLQPGFIARSGRFEMKMTQGSTDLIPYGRDTKLMWMLAGGNQVGVMNDTLRGSGLAVLFPSENPVLDIIDCGGNDVHFHARRPGTATIRFISQAGPTIERCELRVIVEADTSDIDKAIKSALPGSTIKVVPIRNAAMLSGTVSTEADIALATEIAEQFYPKIINRLKVVANDNAAATTKDVPREDVPQSPPSPLPKSYETATAPAASSPAVVAASSKGVKLAAAESLKQPRRQRNLAELNALRDEVRGLRDDVRRLSELLEKRLAIKDHERPAVYPAAVLPTEHSSESEIADVKDGMLFFTAEWCGPCQQMRPIVQRLQRDGLPIQIVDVDQNARLTQQYQVQSIPCFVFMTDGKEVVRITGMMNEKGLRSRLKEPLAKQGEIELMLIEGRTAIYTFGRPAGVIEPDQSNHLTITRLTASDYHFMAKKAGDVTLQVLFEGDTKPAPFRVQVKENPFVKALSDEVTWKFDQTPLSQVVREITRTTAANVVLDKESLIEQGVAAETLITMDVRSVSLRSALKLMLEPLHLTFVTDKEFIKITSLTRAEGPLTVVTYSIADLITLPPEKLNEEKRPVDAAKKNSAPNDAAAVKPTALSPAKNGEQLVKVIQQTVHPDSWDEVGGAGSIRLHESTLSLVIRQTNSIHARIAHLLNSLRRLRAKAGAIVDFGSLVKESRQESNDRSWRQLGLRLEPLPEKERPQLGPQHHGGMKVFAVKPDSPAASNDIRKDDVLVGLDRWEITSFDNVSFILDQPGTKDSQGDRSLKFYVMRGGEMRYGFLQLAPSQSDADGMH